MSQQIPCCPQLQSYSQSNAPLASGWNNSRGFSVRMHRANESKSVSCSIHIFGAFEYYFRWVKSSRSSPLICRVCVARGPLWGMRASGRKLSIADGLLVRG